MKLTKYTKLSLLVILFNGLMGCASNPIQAELYLLRSDITSNVSTEIDTTKIRLNTVKVASYIDQSGLVLQTTDGQVNVARYHRWAEPLKYGLTSYLAKGISLSSGKYVHISRLSSDKSQKTKIDVFIDQMHGTADGKAALSATWTITVENKGAKSYKFSNIKELNENGYPALVESQKILLGEFAKEIAESIQ
ncbi:MAG TPA: hypothetical protein EYQ42_04720 [Thiotrichaceae bacterium]|nr:hypothetical protein [Thiotrichaceae bacterium]HIM07249.1 hypothetical protein [Gammaproteobacteria bacterium]